MRKKLLALTTVLSLAAIVSLGLPAAYASEVTGTLSSGGSSSVGSGGTTSGSISGSVTGGSVIAGNVGGGSSGGGGSSRNSNNGQVLGASTDAPVGSYPGFPNTGRAEQ